MMRIDRSWQVRLSGMAGILGAILWTLGDALIIGAQAAGGELSPALSSHAGQIHLDIAVMMLSSSEPRLAAGALVADVGIVFYLAGCWHLLQGLLPAGRLWAWPCFALLVCGNAWSPLGHAGFYYLGMVYKTLAQAPADAQAALLELSDQFHRVLTIAWLLAVVTLGLALLLLGAVIARGRSAWPRWFALVANPLSLVVIGTVIARVLPEPSHTWLLGAGFNLGWLVVYALSTALLWNANRVDA
jgi:hypothetical protein